MHRDVNSYPVIAEGVSVVYNLPGMPVGFTLQLRLPTLAYILLGNISYWDDPAIKFDNPQYASSLPHKLIQRSVRAGSSGMNNLLSHGLNATVPAFGATLGVGFTQNYGNVTKVPGQTIYNALIAVSQLTYVLTNAYFICVVSTDTASVNKATVGLLINDYGTPMSISSAPLEVAAIEAGVPNDLTKYGDFSNQKSEYAWYVLP